RRLLQERAAVDMSERSGESISALEKIAFEHKDETRRLRGLWALHVMGAMNESRIERGIRNDNLWVRAWSIQLALEDGKAAPSQLQLYSRLAETDQGQLVRRYLASGLQRLSLEDRKPIVQELLFNSAHRTDDETLRLMHWYAL